jgi:hypothetical protein
VSVAHPSFYAYQLGCRCPGCTKANRDACETQRQQRRLRAAADPALVTHGLYGYTNWGCRCDVCTKANRDRSRAYRARKAAR